MKAVLVVAWFWTRMLPITKTIPKEMLPVWDKPVIQYAVESLVDAGIKDIVMITSQQKKVLEDYFDKNYELEDMLIKKWKNDLLEMINKPKNMANYCFVKQTQVLGTGHAVLQIRHCVEDYFFVIFGDAIYPPTLFWDMIDYFNINKNPIIAVHEVPIEEIYRYGVIQTDWEKAIKIVEKPRENPRENPISNLICNGVYLLPKEIFPILENIPINQKKWEYLLPDALNILMKDMDVNIFKTQPFWDIWSVDLWMKANNKIFVDGKLF